jgi:hypothetical protein
LTFDIFLHVVRDAEINDEEFYTEEDLRKIWPWGNI